MESKGGTDMEADGTRAQSEGSRGVEQCGEHRE